MAFRHLCNAVSEATQSVQLFYGLNELPGCKRKYTAGYNFAQSVHKAVQFEIGRNVCCKFNTHSINVIWRN